MNPLSTRHPATGIAVIVQYQQKILLGRRCKPPMPNSWQLPGGWLHWQETPQQAVSRLLAEFSGMQFDRPRFRTFTNNVFDEHSHSVSLYFSVNCTACAAADMAANRQAKDWQWCCWNELPQPLFLPLHLLQQSGFEPFVR